MRTVSDERATYIAQANSDEQIESSPEVEFRDPIKELGFAKIDHIITLDAELSDGAYRTYAMLHYYWQRKSAAWVGSDTLAIVRDTSEATISNHLKELKDAGLITRQRRMGRTSMTYLEDLPKRYAEAAKIILSKRQKTSGKLSKKLDVSNQKDLAYRRRTIEGEPLKDIGDSKTESPAPSKEEYQQTEPHYIVKDTQAQCGHLLTSIVSIDEGTAYCRDCVAGKATTDADFAAMPSASATPAPVMSEAARELFRQFKRRRWSTPAQQEMFETTEREVGSDAMMSTILWAAQSGDIKHPVKAICTAARRYGKEKPRGNGGGKGAISEINDFFERLKHGVTRDGPAVIDVSPRVPEPAD